MKKVVFLSCEDLLDVDLPIVKEIHKEFDFIWIIVLRGYGWFTEEQLYRITEDLGIQVRILHQNTKLKNPKTFVFHLKLLKLLRSLNPDIVYDSYQGTPWMHFVANFFISRSKFVLAIHDVVQHYNMHFRFVREQYNNFLMRNYKNIHVFSPSQLYLFERKYRNKNTLLAPLCLKDFGSIAYPSDKEKVKGEVKFLFFGIIRANKGVDLIISAMNRIATKYPNVSVTIAGRSDENYWSQYEPLILYRNSFNLQIRTIEDYEIPQLFNTHQFILLPYRDVTQSGVLLTAYNYKVPAIASDLEGFAEYIQDGENGFLFDVLEEDAFVSVLEKAIEMNNNSYQDMVRNLVGFVENEISTPGIARKYVDYFNCIS